MQTKQFTNHKIPYQWKILLKNLLSYCFFMSRRPGLPKMIKYELSKSLEKLAQFKMAGFVRKFILDDSKVYSICQDGGISHHYFLILIL